MPKTTAFNPKRESQTAPPKIYRLLPWAICAALALLVFAAFGQALSYGFLNWDDVIYIRDYPEVKAGISLEGFFWAWTHPHYSNWHPLTTLSLMLDTTLFGERGGAFHAHNLALHAAAAFLLFLALHKLTGSLGRSAFAAALFSVHPLRVESVVWITERKDVFSGFFCMATLLAYAHYAAKPSPRRYWLTAGLFVCGLLSKSILVTLPLLLLLLDFWPLSRFCSAPAPPWALPHTQTPKSAKPGWLLLREKLPLLALSLASGVATLLSADLHRPMAPPPFWERLAYIPVWCITYLRQFFVPLDLAAHYPYAQYGPLPSVALGSLLLCVAVSLACFFSRKRLPVLAFAWAWFLVALLPVIGFIPPGIQIIADRYTYISQIGLAIAAAWVGHTFFSRLASRWPAYAVATLVLAALLTLSFFQTTHWKNDEALWRHTVQVTRENDFANGQLGDSLAVQNRFSEAEPFYREALRLNPSLAGVLHNLALVERQKGNPAEAESLLRRATQISPWFTSAQLDLVSVLTVQKKYQEAIDLLTPILQREPHNTDALLQSAVILSENLPSPENLALALQRVQQALTLRPEWPEAHFISGNVLLLSNSPDEAMKAYDTALQKNPRLAPAAHNLGTLLARANRFPEASAAYQKAIAANPDSVEAYDSLADIYVRQKMPAAAISVWKQSLQRKPNEIRVLYKLAWILSTHPEASVRNGKEAEHFAQQAISIAKGSEPLLFDALAAAYAEQERFPEAVESQQKALATLSNKANPLHGALSARLSNYQAKLPFRSEP